MGQISSLRNPNMNWLMIPTLLYIVCKIDCQTVTITKDPPTAVTVGANVILKCLYNGSASETGVKWFNSSDTTGHAYTSSCGSFPGLAAFYDTTRLNASCNSTVNVYSLTIATKLNDNLTLWGCSYQFSGGASPISSSSSVQISFEDFQTVTITKDPPTAVKVGANVTLICTYNGSASETGVKWFNGSDTNGHAFTSSCVSSPGPAASYDTTRLTASCNSTINVYSLTIATKLNDNLTLWGCSYQFSGGANPISSSSSVQISFEDFQTVTVTKDPPTAVKVGANVTLICTYNGPASETGVKWFNGSDTTGHAYTSSCVSFPGLAAFYDTTRISASCNATVNVYSLTIATKLNDNLTLWGCSYQFSGGASPISSSSSVQISFEVNKTNLIKSGKEGLTEKEKIGIGAGCSVAGALMIAGIAGVLYRKNTKSSTTSNTLVHHNSSNGEYQLQKQSVNNQTTDSSDKHLSFNGNVYDHKQGT